LQRNKKIQQTLKQEHKKEDFKDQLFVQGHSELQERQGVQ